MAKTDTAAELIRFDIDVEEIAGLETQFDVFRFMKRLADFYGFKTFMVFNLPAPTATGLAGSSIITNWPAEMLSLFDREIYGQAAYALRNLRRSSLPFTYDLDDTQADYANRDARETFVRFGVARGVYFPVHDGTGTRGAVTLGGLSAAPSHQQMMELAYVCAHVFERLAQIRNVDVRVHDILTERETDCLNWTAAGKTSAEIADILGLSEHTVNHYLNRAAKKLDTVNRTQAVAKALRTGIIK